ncbi:MAG TPA: hypothetical protein VLQ45_09725 [Thermoanaerobaculia bacterium]|nr:hypothetical protein [Thermoanaerobaculia bacterium]
MLNALKASFQKQICPYCFESYKLAATPFRCASPAQRCTPEVDAVRASKWQDNAPIGRVLPPGKRQKDNRCPNCSQVSRKRICPHCHMDLPHTTGKYRNLIFAVIGAKEAGKSHYIAVLIEQIRKHIGPALGILLEPLDDHTIKRYRQDFYEPIFRKGIAINATQSALADRRVQLPLVYTLTLTGKDIFGRDAIKGVVTLVFFDTAGEDLNSRTTMGTVNKYICQADGIILLLDPLQLPNVRDRLNGSVTLPLENTETSSIIERTTELIRGERKLSLETKIKAPLAVAFSKFDAVDPLLDPQMQLNAEPDHRAGYDLADFHAVTSEMQSLLQDWDGGVIPQQATTHYRRSGFFGLTALGCNPGQDKKIPRVLPRRVEDPFLWLLHCHGLIPTAKRSS